VNGNGFSFNAVDFEAKFMREFEHLFVAREHDALHCLEPALACRIFRGIHQQPCHTAAVPGIIHRYTKLANTGIFGEHITRHANFHFFIINRDGGDKDRAKSLIPKFY
jgi:hypothetical protein